MERAVVLSSGGVDSTTCVGLAVEKFGRDKVSTVSVYYGQRHDKELDCAKRIAEYYRVDHYVIDLSNTGIFDNSNCSLLKHSTDAVEYKSYAEQVRDNVVVNTYVPFRNGLILSAVASFALSLYPNDDISVYLGIHADDVVNSAYADCSIEFSKYMNKAVLTGTYNKVRLVSPLVSFNKSQVVAEGLRVGVPYELTWSCYEGGDKPCGKCATCLDREKAFKDNGVEDPAYAEVYKD